MICVVIDAAVGVVDVVIVAVIAVIAVITAVVTAVMAAVATAYGTRVQARGAKLTAQALTTDTEWDLKTEGGIGAPLTDKTGGRVPAEAGPAFCVGILR